MKFRFSKPLYIQKLSLLAKQKPFLFLVACLVLTAFAFQFFPKQSTSRTTLLSGKDFVQKSENELQSLPDRDFTTFFPSLEQAFADVSFSIQSDFPLAKTKVAKATDFDSHEKKVQSSFDLSGIKILTEYQDQDNEGDNRSVDGAKIQRIKQTIYVENQEDQDKVINFSVKSKINSDTVIWEGREYKIGEKEQSFEAYEKTASIPEFAQDIGVKDTEGIDNFSNYVHTYQAGIALVFQTADGKQAVYDWGDAASLNHEVLAYQTEEGYFLELFIFDFPVGANQTAVIDPAYALSDNQVYEARYDGPEPGAMESPSLTSGGIAIGDLNNDGIDDLVIGAFRADNNGTDSGSAFVVFGSSDISTGTKPFNIQENYNIRFDGAVASEWLTYNSWSIHPALIIGDLTGDGANDLVIGTSQADYGGDDSGSAYIIFSELIQSFGTTTGNNLPLSTSSNYNIRFDGGAASDYMTDGGGIIIGDVNGDGKGDLVLDAAAADNNGNYTGSVWVIFSTLIDDVGTTTGNNLPLSTASNYNIRFDGGAEDGIASGYNLYSPTVIGDVNGDGFDDLAIPSGSSSYNGSDSGSVYIIFSTLIDDVGVTTGNNKPLDVSTNYNIRFDGAASDNLSDGDIVIGDVNGDGASDLVLSAPEANNNGSISGSVYLIFSTLIDDVGVTTGNNKPLDVSTNYSIRFDGAAEYARLSMNSYDYIAIPPVIGDVNGDGVGDLVIGSNSDVFYLIFSTLIDDVGTTTGNNLPLSTSTNYNISYSQGGSEFRHSAIGDVNGDGEGDLILASDRTSNNGSESGSVYVMFSTLIDDVGVTTGNNLPLSTSANYNIRFDGAAEWEYLTGYGNRSIAIGDLNYDGANDLFLGASEAENNGYGTGSAYMMFSTLIDDVGSTTGNNKPLSTSSNYNIRFDGNLSQISYLSGNGAVVIGDLNGDDIDDLVVGAYRKDFGSAWVIFGGNGNGSQGRSLEDSSSYNIRYEGAVAADSLTGEGAVAIGDVNGDGKNDLVLGAYGSDNNGANSGSAYVMFSTLIDDVSTTTGNNFSLANSSSFNLRYDGAVAGDYLTRGSSVSGIKTVVIEDLNNDGKTDLLLGANSADNNGAYSGSAYVMFSTLIDDVGVTTGNNFSLANSSNFNLRYDGAGANSVLSLGGIAVGDVNGDGVPDLVLGAPNEQVSSSYYAGSAYVIFSTLFQDVGETTGNIKPLSTASNFNVKYWGPAGGWNLTKHGVFINDVNADGKGDLIITQGYTNYSNYTQQGSVLVMFSTRIDDVGETTGNVKNVYYDSSCYNIRFDGGLTGDSLGRYGGVAIGDVNGDGFDDLVMGASNTDNNSKNDSGSVYLVYSSLIKTVGETTGNVWRLNTASRFNIRFDGAEVGDYLSYYNGIEIGDVNGDDISDLVLGSYGADNNGANSGSVWVAHSSLLNITGETTGNVRRLYNASDYSIRYDGAVAGDQLTLEDSLVIGDATGDGKGELLLGSYLADNNGTDSGSLWVIDSQATPLYFSVGQDAATDRKTGSPTVSIVSGTATFSEAQTGNIGVGDAITYDTNKICYISGKTSQTVWSCHTVTGTVPDDISDSEVVSIGRAFSSLANAEAGAETLLGTSDLVLNKFQLNFPCYYDSGPDTTAVTINGWTTSGNNFIKIYTPFDIETEVNQSQRHLGVYDANKWSLENYLINYANDVRLEGLQVKTGLKTSNTMIAAAAVSGVMRVENCYLENTATGYGGIITNNITNSLQAIWLANSILVSASTYNHAYSGTVSNAKTGVTHLLYNNTLIGGQYANVYRGSGTIVGYNNIVQRGSLGCFNGTSISGDYNISSDATAPGANSQRSVSLSFADSANKDYHLALTDTLAVNTGKDLSQDQYLFFDNDIDRETRNVDLRGWDIGADETPGKVFRSVGPSDTTDLNVDSRTVAVTGSIATFSDSMPDNIGVGDVIQYEVESVHHLAFIYERISDTDFTVRKSDISDPVQASAGTQVSVFRAYTSLANAEAGIENVSIDLSVRNFDDWTVGGEASSDDLGRDLVTNNEQWNIACYSGNEGTADSVAVSVDDWATDQQHYLKIYTPVSSDETGVRQRHLGTWDGAKYQMVVVESGDRGAVDLHSGYFFLEGLQIKAVHSSSNGHGIDISSGEGTVTLLSNIIQGEIYGSGFANFGVKQEQRDSKIYNNLIYGWGETATDQGGIMADSGALKNVLIYNNTIVNSGFGIMVESGGVVIAKNNLAYDNIDNYVENGDFHLDSTNNLSGPIQVDAPGNSPVNAATVKFADAFNKDFHLNFLDTFAVDAGAELNSDPYIFFSFDFEGDERAVNWDIGADEMRNSQYMLEGDFNLEGSVNFE